MPNVLLDAKNRNLPALVTPLTDDGQLDEPSAVRLIDHLYRQGVGGLYVLGSTGEGVYLDFPLRRRLAEVAVRESRGRGKVIIHVGAVQAAQAYELATHAEQVGADAVSSIPPFVGGFSWAEIEGYYRELCRASSLPVIAYYIPHITGRAVPLDDLAKLTALPNIGGYKFTETNLYMMQCLVRRLRPDQIMYNGPDEMLALGLGMGAHGGIGTTYNFMPELILNIFRAVQEGRHADALATQREVNVIIEMLLAHQGLAASKQILYWQGLIDSPRCAAPRASLTADEQQLLRRRLLETSLAPTLVR
jgi:N-acetylneuraminate lyase